MGAKLVLLDEDGEALDKGERLSMDDTIENIIQDLKEYGAQVSVYDPQADAELVKLEYNIELLQHLEDKLFDAIVLAVAHREFEQIDLEKLKANTAVVYDVKGFLTEGVDGRL